MRNFTKNEMIGVGVIFLVLLVMTIPNLQTSIRRARDQVRKDDMGAIMRGLEEYKADYGIFPQNSDDAKILGCKKPGDKVEIDALGRLKVNLIACNWGTDGLIDLTPGSSKVYVALLPRDPYYLKGADYAYFSDGHRYQFLVHLEGKDEAEYDPIIEARHVMCGNVYCNAGRMFDVPKNMSIRDYDAELLKTK